MWVRILVRELRYCVVHKKLKKKKRMRSFVWGLWNMTDVLMRGEAGHVKT